MFSALLCGEYLYFVANAWIENNKATPLINTIADFTVKLIIKKIFITLSLIPLYYSNTNGQTMISIAGSVIDKAIGKGMPPVSVIADKNNGTSTNSKGEFYLQLPQQLIVENGLTFTYIGHKKNHISFSEKKFITIATELVDNAILEVAVYGSGKSMLQKTIERIPINYPAIPFTQTRLTCVCNLVGDTDFFYKSDAVVKIYYPGYAEQSKTEEIKVIQNNQLLLKNSKSSQSDSIFNALELSGNITALKVPAIDTAAGKAAHKKNIITSWHTYVHHGNLSAGIFISTFPLKTILPAKLPFLTNYGLGAGLQFKLYKNIFLTYHGINNYGIDGITSFQRQIFMSYVLGLNKIHRSIGIVPMFGYSMVAFSNKSKTEKGKVYSWIGGSTLNLELTHVKKIFIAGWYNGWYNKTFNKNITGIAIARANFNLAAGLLSRF